MEHLAEVKNLKKYYPAKKKLFKERQYVKAVDDVSFYIDKGETFGVVGESGCGKSTLCKTMIRLTEPTGGSVFFNGRDIASLSPEEMRLMRQHIQIIFQDPYASLNPRMTVRELIKAPLDIFSDASEEEKMEGARKAAMDITGGRPILSLLPFVHKKVGIVTTGNEVYTGRIKDTFTPVILEKLSEFDAEVIGHITLNDDDKRVTAAIRELIEKGADVVVCTGGMSVDPDDRTPLAIKNTGSRIVSYGAPVLPGAMFLLSYYETGREGKAPVAVMGLPGCVMYAKRTIFDLVLPRVMADDPVTAEDLAALGQGGLCLSCPVCTFPNCGFGKGM